MSALARAPLFETRLHAVSPFGPVLTGGVIAAALFAGYAALAACFGQPMLTPGPENVEVDTAAWAAFVQSLIFAAALTMPELGRRQWLRALPELEQTLDSDGQAAAGAIAAGPPRRAGWSSLAAFLAGAVVGFAFNGWVMTAADIDPAGYVRSVGLWFLLVSPLLFGLGARAALQLRNDERAIAELVASHLAVGVDRLEALEVYGRLATRNALSWLVMAAIILLFFVFSTPIAVSVGSLILSLAAGAYAFASTVAPVVRAATALRNAALVRVRTQIAAAGEAALKGEGAVALSELTAYEAWLQARPVWPISAPVTRRLALYGLIPVLAWFGAAAAELALDRIA